MRGVQESASYARLVKCAHQSAGKAYGPGGATMGNVHFEYMVAEPKEDQCEDDPSNDCLSDARCEVRHQLLSPEQATAGISRGALEFASAVGGMLAGQSEKTACFNATMETSEP